jgi:hypothetical protein
MFFKNTGIYYYLKKKSGVNTHHTPVYQNNENLRGNLANIHYQHCMVKDSVVRDTGSFVTSLPAGGDSGR